MDDEQRRDEDAKPPKREPRKVGGEQAGAGPTRSKREEAARLAQERRNQADARLSRRASWATIISALLAAAGLLIAYLAFIKGDDPVPAATPGTAKLERVDLIARNSSSPNEPGLELLVRNGGGGRSVVSRAQIEILRVYPIPLCFTQGSLPVTERYRVELPPNATPGKTVDVPLHQQIAGNGADRFVIDLGVDPDRIGKIEGPAAETLKAELTKGALPGLYLFEVAVALIHDGSTHPLRMGTALISMPELPLSSEFVLERGEFRELTETFVTYGDLADTWASPLACWQENGRRMQRALSSDATRSAELEQTLASAVVPEWSELED